MKKSITQLLLALFLVFASGRSFAQKSGYSIRNYLPKEYKGFNQMWQAAQDKNGMMYFASTSYVFMYSGQYWDQVKIKLGAATRQIFIDPADGTIYIGSVGDFGYIERDKNGNWNYISMLPQLDKDHQAFNDVWKIYSVNGHVYFQSSEWLFKTKNKKLVKIIDPPAHHTFALSFVAGGHFYLRTRELGLMELSNTDQLTLVPGGEIFKDKRILAINRLSASQNLVLTGDEGFILMHAQPDPKTNSCFDQKKYAVDDFLKNGGVLGSHWISDSQLVVNSRSGLAIYKKSGKLKEIINKESGLSDESIADIFIDREENIWVLSNNGISCVAYNSPLQLFDDKSGFTGTLEMLCYYNNALYAASSDGLFKTQGRDSLHPAALTFVPTPVVNTEIWSMFDSGDGLLASTSDGLVRVTPAKTEQLSLYYTNQSKKMNTGEIVTAEKNGLSVIKNVTGKKYEVVRHYDIPGEEILQIGKVTKVSGKNDRYNVWGLTRFKNVLDIEFGIKDSSLAIKTHTITEKKAYEDYFLLYIGDSLYFCTNNSCYRYVPGKAKDTTSYEYAPDIFKKVFYGQADVQPPINCKLFFSQPDSLLVFGMDESGKVISKKIRMPQKFMDNSTLNYMMLQPDGKMLGILDNFIAVYDTKKVHDAGNGDFHCFIKNVLIGNDSLIYRGQGNSDPVAGTEIPYAKNHIVFKFEAPYFYLDDMVAFSYRLEGYDTAWSKPSALSVKDFSNLPEGAYTFRVKAYNSSGYYSSEASYTFVIAAPWYRTVWAYMLYAILFLAVMFFTVKLSANRLRRQKERLEELVKQRTSEVVQQKQMLETAYVEIQDSMHYARRIQTALMASDQLLQEQLKDYFVFYKPKDIVSGDFYWAQPKGDWLYMITADCTGHGVPGAFMSLLNISFLNEAVNSSGFIKPDEILGYVRTHIISALKADGSEEGGKDGMDCVLCAYNFKTNTLLAALSNNPILIVRNKKLIEIKPDKFPVGRHDKDHQAFTLQEIALQPGDVIYTYTDGYADQFGGASGKKFKPKQFKQLLLDLAPLPMDQQEQAVEKTLADWQGKLEQVDDILVIGVKI